MGQITMWNRPGRKAKNSRGRSRGRRAPPRYKSGPKKGLFMSRKAAAASRRMRAMHRSRGNPWVKVKARGKKRKQRVHVSRKAIARGVKAWRKGGKKRAKVKIRGRTKRGKKVSLRLSAGKLKRYLKGRKKTLKRGKSRTGSPRKKSRSKSKKGSKTMAKKKGRGRKKAKAKSHRKSSKLSRAARKGARTRAAKKAKRRAAAKKAARARKRKGGRKGKRRGSRKASRRGKRRGGRKAKLRIRIRRRGRRVSVTASAGRRRVSARRSYRGKGKRRHATGVSFRRGNGIVSSWAPGFMRPYVARVEQGLTYVPGAVVGVAAANILPRFLPSWNVGWWSILLSLVGTGIGAGAAAMVSEKQALSAAIGGGFATAVKAVALLTSPTNPIRNFVGIGLSDLADYSGLSDGMSDLVGDDDLASFDDDVSELTDVGTSGFGQIGMDDQVEVGMSGMDDQVTLDSY